MSLTVSIKDRDGNIVNTPPSKMIGLHWVSVWMYIQSFLSHWSEVKEGCLWNKTPLTTKFFTADRTLSLSCNHFKKYFWTRLEKLYKRLITVYWSVTDFLILFFQWSSRWRKQHQLIGLGLKYTSHKSN